MPRLFILLLLLSNLFMGQPAGLMAGAKMVDAVQKMDNGVDAIEPVVDFAKRTISFAIQITGDDQPLKGFVYIQPEAREGNYYPLRFSSSGIGSFVLDLEENPLRVFSRIAYSFQVEFSSGKNVRTEEAFISYTDTRFKWQTLIEDGFEIHYYERDIAFGQSALNSARRGLDKAQMLFPAAPDSLIRIYIYTDPKDLQESWQGLSAWSAGHAAPDLGMAFVSIPSGPEQQLELDRQIPHEIVHILQYRALGDSALKMPAWLLEGSASVAETYRNPEYTRALQTAVKNDRLLPFESVCSSFPRDASGAFLAYAQSQSFVGFLLGEFGAPALTQLFTNYANGMNCIAGFEQAYGFSLQEAEYRWRLETLNINPALLVMRNLLPYILLLVVVFGAASLATIFTFRGKSKKVSHEE
jgi:hypothetical protein